MAPTPKASKAIGQLYDTPAIEAFGMLVETHNELLNATVKTLEAEVGVAPPWLGVLIRLARSPGEQLRMTELAKDMTISTSGLTRLIDRVEAAGHVRREPCPNDRRGLLAVLTPEGRKLAAKAAGPHVADLERLFSPLEPDELEQLTDLLRRVRNHARGICET